MEMNHGTANAYNNHKCRCVECRIAWAETTRNQKAKRFLKVEDARHGTAHGYSGWNCRCGACTRAWADYSREYRASRRELQPTNRSDQSA